MVGALAHVVRQHELAGKAVRGQLPEQLDAYAARIVLGLAGPIVDDRYALIEHLGMISLIRVAVDVGDDHAL